MAKLLPSEAAHQEESARSVRMVSASQIDRRKREGGSDREGRPPATHHPAHVAPYHRDYSRSAEIPTLSEVSIGFSIKLRV